MWPRRRGYGRRMRTLTDGEVADHRTRSEDRGYTSVEEEIDPDLVDEMVQVSHRVSGGMT